MRIRVEVWVGGAESGRLCAEEDSRGKLGAGESDGMAVLGRTCRFERETGSETEGRAALAVDPGPAETGGREGDKIEEFIDVGEKVRSGVNGGT